MSQDELQRVFYVDHPSLVPEYQLIQLNHHVAKRHVASPGSDKHHTGNKVSHGSGKKSAHDKLSDHEYLIKNAHKFNNLNQGGQARAHFVDRDDFDDTDILFVGSDNAKSVKDSATVKSVDSEASVNNASSDKVNKVAEGISDVPKANSTSASAKKNLEDVEHLDENLEHGVHKIKFEAFGKPIELVLKKTEGLFKKEGLKVWTVVKNETQPHGVEFLEEVSNYFLLKFNYFDCFYPCDTRYQKISIV